MQKIKYGVIFYPQTDNLGDHIQTYAAAQLLPHVDYGIDRENMHLFQSHNHESVYVLMNAWYMHNKANFILSRDIRPICVSMHFSKYDYFDIGYDFLSGEGGKWLKQYEPIGCRDKASLDECISHGIKGYFSGCITLTLQSQKNTPQNGNYVCVVDLSKEEVNAIKAELDEKGIQLQIATHLIKEQQKFSLKEALNLAQEQLILYQNARCVITSRLHCALPCLAMQVPVVLVNDPQKDDPLRFSSFLHMLNITTKNDILEHRLSIDWLHPTVNSSDYKVVRDTLFKDIQNRLKNIKQIPAPYSDEIDQKQQFDWHDQMIDRIIEHAKKKILYLTEKNQEFFAWAKNCEEENKLLTAKNEEFLAWAKNCEEENKLLTAKNEEFFAWAKNCESQSLILMENNRNLSEWAKACQTQNLELIKKNQKLFQWSCHLEKQLKEIDIKKKHIQIGIKQLLSNIDLSLLVKYTKCILKTRPKHMYIYGVSEEILHYSPEFMTCIDAIISPFSITNNIYGKPILGDADIKKGNFYFISSLYEKEVAIKKLSDVGLQYEMDFVWAPDWQGNVSWKIPSCYPSATWKEKESSYDFSGENGPWDYRYRILLEYLSPTCLSVIDCGAGNMSLSKMLPNRIQYYPIDYCPKFPETIVSDLNAGEFPDLNTDAIFMCGILEYMEHPEILISQVCRHTDHVLLTYNSLSKDIPMRQRHALGWKNHLSTGDVIGLFQKEGFHLIREIYADAPETYLIFDRV